MKAEREPRSAAAFVPAKTAPFRVDATTTFHTSASRWEASGASWSSTSLHRPENSCRPTNPAIRPPMMLKGMKRILAMEAA